MGKKSKLSLDSTLGYRGLRPHFTLELWEEVGSQTPQTSLAG